MKTFGLIASHSLVLVIAALSIAQSANIMTSALLERPPDKQIHS